MCFSKKKIIIKFCAVFIEKKTKLIDLVTRTSCSTLACSQLILHKKNSDIFNIMEVLVHLSSAQIFLKFYVHQKSCTFNILRME